MQKFIVGGFVRDQILGVKSKDVDFTVVLDDGEADGMDPFRFMVITLKAEGFKVFLETPEHFTVRAQFPRDSDNAGLTADFVLARKEGAYSDGRRPDSVQVGTLLDDLARRDFTMNAMARGADNALIDPFFGQVDIADRIVRAVGDPLVRLREDALRAVRAVRFSVTKGFAIEPGLAAAMESDEIVEALFKNISDERIADELSKMFRFDTLASIQVLNDFPSLTEAMFFGRVSLDSTLKTKGRGR